MPFKGLITLLQTNKELTILMYGDSYKMSRFLQEKTFKVWLTCQVVDVGV
jgi:fatty acid/phospholipid biosynthesis enzyme